MREVDIVVAGGGLAGSLAAAMLARLGLGVAMVDPHPVYPPDLRCEKLIGRQIAILRRTGLAEQILAAATLDGECWVARAGRVVEKVTDDQYGILYDTLVNTVRAAIPDSAALLWGKVTQIANGAQRQIVTVSTGETLSARLVIVANGLNTALRHSLGMEREDLSKSHCLTIAFDLKPTGSRDFPFRALTYFAECTAARTAYITLFPIGATMRANLMTYRGLQDEWLVEMRQHPEAALATLLPRLRRLTGDFEVVSALKIRPADVYETRGYLQPGVVLVGDAFASSCPAAGTGTDKVFTDVERLCNIHVPQWLTTHGMGLDKIARFYEDPVKLACDRRSLEKAFASRSIAVDNGIAWRVHRLARYVGPLAVYAARNSLARLRVEPQARKGNVAS